MTLLRFWCQTRDWDVVRDIFPLYRLALIPLAVADYRAHDIRSYHTLKLRVDPGECMPSYGHPMFLQPPVVNPGPENETGVWMVTSPNMSYIPEPPYGDRMIHPQFLCRRFLWMCLIPAPSPENRHLYWVPKPDDAPGIEGSALQTDARTLKREFVDALRKEIGKVSKKAFEVLAQHPKNTLLSTLAMHATQCLERLANFGVNYGTLLTTVADAQRCCLDMMGIMNQITIYDARSLPTSQDDLEKFWPVDKSLMGCFTHDPKEVTHLHRIGVPVWWMRPHTQINCQDTRIHLDARQTEYRNSEYLVTEEYLPFNFTKPIFDVVYEGPPGTDLQLATQNVGSRMFDMVEPSRIALEKMSEKRGYLEKTRGGIQHGEYH